MDPWGLCPAKKPYVYYAGVGGFAGIAELIAWVTAPAFEFITGVVSSIVSGISIAVVAVEAAVVAAIVLVFSTDTGMDEEYLLYIYSKSTESKPTDCPPGTVPIDQYPGLDKDDIHTIKDGVDARPKDWTGIDPDGNVITTDNDGKHINNGPFDIYLP